MSIPNLIDTFLKRIADGDDLDDVRNDFENLLRVSPYIEDHLGSSSAYLIKLQSIPALLEAGEQRNVKSAELAEANRRAVLASWNVEQIFKKRYLKADLLFESHLDSHRLNSNDTQYLRKTYQGLKGSFVREWIALNTVDSRCKELREIDEDQASAVGAVNGHVQVVARAGSGKTSTLVNRTLFLLMHCGVAPSQMLLLAFNRKAVFEIRRRLLGLLSAGAEVAVVEEIARRCDAIQKNGIARDDIDVAAVDAVAADRNVDLPHIMTFHALARSVANFEGEILFDEPDGDAQGLSRVFQKVIDDHLQIPKVHQQIRELMLAHFREDWDRIVEGGYDQCKEELLKFRRSLPRESLGGDYVKSYGEKAIADFLFEHAVPYKYERNTWWSGINYRPDFTLFRNERRGHENGVIIEYFGLAGDSDYDKMSEAKRKYWAQKKDWDLIEITPIPESVSR